MGGLSTSVFAVTQIEMNFIYHHLVQIKQNMELDLYPLNFKIIPS